MKKYLLPIIVILTNCSAKNSELLEVEEGDPFVFYESVNWGYKSKNYNIEEVNKGLFEIPDAVLNSPIVVSSPNNGRKVYEFKKTRVYPSMVASLPPIPAKAILQ